MAIALLSDGIGELITQSIIVYRSRYPRTNSKHYIINGIKNGKHNSINIQMWQLSVMRNTLTID